MTEELSTVVVDNKTVVAKTNWFVSIIDFIKSRAKAIYLSIENKIKLFDGLINEFIKDMSSNRNRIIIALFVGVLLIFKFSGNVLLGVISFVGLLLVIGTWLVFYNRNSTSKP